MVAEEVARKEEQDYSLRLEVGAVRIEEALTIAGKQAMDLEVVVAARE